MPIYYRRDLSLRVNAAINHSVNKLKIAMYILQTMMASSSIYETNTMHEYKIVYKH